MIVAALIFLMYICRALPTSLLGASWPFMHAELGVPIENAGYISAMISCGTILASLFSHRLIRRFGTGRVTAVCVLMCAAALLGFCLSPSFVWLLILALPLGLGMGEVDLGLNAFVAENYSAVYMNWLHCCWGIGSMIGPALISALAQAGQGWRSGYLSISAIYLTVAMLMAASLSKWRRMEAIRPAVREKSTEEAGESKGTLAILRIRGAAVTLLIFFLYAAIENSIMLWGASYLVNARSILAESAAGWISLFFLGLTVGRALSGVASLKFSSGTLIKGGAFCVVAGLLLLMLPLSAPLMICVLIFIGLGLAPIIPCMMHQTPQLFGKENNKAAVGLQLVAAYAGTTLMPALLGQLFSHVSFQIMPGALLICAVLMLLCSLRLSVNHKLSQTGAAHA